MTKHYLKHRSSGIVVILRSLRHGACVCCGKPFDGVSPGQIERDLVEHWIEELQQAETPPEQIVMDLNQ